ncbi:hypothetical protein RFI_17929 [Reticulomyxa filosa]|uniref:Ubiquitin-like domain-containing protein n=1 Tax=Reticulomyxa filosa TaxID=46433 RepID=X6MZR4_RETFI|nr:hypothetical protein RFI_17929 [Reticulomyxa filosa]|eukprot:ETO19301.1 hypothetical protein RFI_17929 [Reticulomyxa filosa]
MKGLDTLQRRRFVKAIQDMRKPKGMSYGESGGVTGMSTTGSFGVTTSSYGTTSLSSTFGTTGLSSTFGSTSYGGEPSGTTSRSGNVHVMCNYLLQQLEQSPAALKASCADCDAEINEKFDRIAATVEDKRKQLLRGVDSLKQEKESKLNEQLSSLLFFFFFFLLKKKNLYFVIISLIKATFFFFILFVGNRLTVCNSSSVTVKERNDAELFYLKWAAAQWSKAKAETEQQNNNNNNISSDDSAAQETTPTEAAKKENGDGDGGDVDCEDDAIQRMFPRYKELKLKWGDQKIKKTFTQNIDTVAVTIQSMDPKSITSQLVEKNLPLSLTVGQLKMLCKRLFQLSPKYQRIMVRNSGDMFPDDMPDDMQTLTYYGVKDRAFILMQSTDFTTTD